MSKKIYITRKIPDIGIDMLREKGYEVDVNPNDEVPKRKDIIKRLQEKQYDAVLTLLTDTIDSEVFDAAPTVKLYANYAIGFNNLDTQEAKKRGILVTNTPGNYVGSIAEHTVALMLGLTTRMVEADDYVRAGKFKGWSPNTFVGTDIQGETFGLIGAGRIGERVAHLVTKGFGMKLVYFDIVPNETIEKEYAAIRLGSVEDVLRQADVVSLHVPLIDSTHHLLNEERLRLMKPTAILINTSRGPVVDEKALVQALQDKIIAGAGLDVYEFEPELSPGLAQLPNVVLTPHIASARESARKEMAVLAAQNIIDYFETGQPKNVVNK